MSPHSGESWAYESLVGAIPGLHLSDRKAIAIQLIVFETAVLLAAICYGQWSAVPAGTAAVLVAAVGSWWMLTVSRRIRELSLPASYYRLLFGSSVEVALSILAFVLFVTYAFVVNPVATRSGLITGLLGPNPPAIAVVLVLVIVWDVIYRIGTCWWTTVVGLWRALRFDFDQPTTSQLLRLDAMNIVFAGFQIALLPFVIGDLVLSAAIVGHLGAVGLVATLSILLQRQSIDDDSD